MKNNKKLPKEQIGVIIPLLSLLLVILPFIRVFTLSMTFIYPQDISSVIFTKTELAISLILSLLMLASLILICLRKTIGIYIYYISGVLTLLTQMTKYGFEFTSCINYIVSIIVPIIYFYVLYMKKNYIYHLKEKTNILIKAGIVVLAASIIFLASINIDNPRNNIRKFQRAVNNADIAKIEDLSNLENSKVNVTKDTLNSVKINDYKIKETNKTDSKNKELSIEFKIYFTSTDENDTILVNDEALKNLTVKFTKVKGQGWVINDVDSLLNEITK